MMRSSLVSFLPEVWPFLVSFRYEKFLREWKIRLGVRQEERNAALCSIVVVSSSSSHPLQYLFLASSVESLADNDGGYNMVASL